MKINLVLLGDYSCDQAGYNSAHTDGAVYIVDIDEASYSSLYNVQQSIQATCNCLGGNVSLGIERDNRFIPLSVIEDTALTPNPDYQDLDEAFELGIKHEKIIAFRLDNLRANVFNSLTKLQNGLNAGSELDRVDHCVDVLENVSATVKV